MKAAVLHEIGGIPRYEDFPDPVAGEDEVVLVPEADPPVQVGESAGRTLALAAESLRTSGVEICGAAKGLGPETMGEAYGQVVAWTQSGELTFDVLTVPLSDIESAWQRTDLRGRRLVVVP